MAHENEPSAAAGQAGALGTVRSFAVAVTRGALVVAPDDRPLSVSVQPPTPPPLSIA